MIKQSITTVNLYKGVISVARDIDCLGSLILYLLSSWTFGNHPEQDLDEFGISDFQAKDSIDFLVLLGYVLEIVEAVGGSTRKVTEILEKPSIFRESIVLTDKGQKSLEKCDLMDLQDRWFTVRDMVGCL